MLPPMPRRTGPGAGPPIGFDVRGWNSIRRVLATAGLELSEVQARARWDRLEAPLPVQPWAGSVVAVKRELRAWAKDEAARKKR